eukprot:2986925-Prymnesium_polylepis.2
MRSSVWAGHAPLPAGSGLWCGHSSARVCLHRQYVQNVVVARARSRLLGQAEQREITGLPSIIRPRLEGKEPGLAQGEDLRVARAVAHGAWALVGELEYNLCMGPLARQGQVKHLQIDRERSQLENLLELSQSPHTLVHPERLPLRHSLPSSLVVERISVPRERLGVIAFGLLSRDVVLELPRFQGLFAQVEELKLWVPQEVLALPAHSFGLRADLVWCDLVRRASVHKRFERLIDGTDLGHLPDKEVHLHDPRWVFPLQCRSNHGSIVLSSVELLVILDGLDTNLHHRTMSYN